MEDDLVGLERKDIGCQGFIYMFPVSAMEGRAMMEEFQNVQELNALEHGAQTWNMNMVNIEPKIASLKQETHLQNAVWLHVFVSRVFRQLETFMIAKLCLEVGYFWRNMRNFPVPQRKPLQKLESHSIHVRYIYLHLAEICRKYGWIYHTWILWETKTLSNMIEITNLNHLFCPSVYGFLSRQLESFPIAFHEDRFPDVGRTLTVFVQTECPPSVIPHNFTTMLRAVEKGVTGTLHHYICDYICVCADVKNTIFPKLANSMQHEMMFDKLPAVILIVNYIAINVRSDENRGENPGTQRRDTELPAWYGTNRRSQLPHSTPQSLDWNTAGSESINMQYSIMLMINVLRIVRKGFNVSWFRQTIDHWLMFRLSGLLV